jgi:hypothetical protein
MAKMVQMKWRGDIAQEIARGAATRALQICAADLQGKSSRQAPVDTGDLRANCTVGPLKQDGGEVYVTVGYDLPYAIVQHERLDFNHPKGGNAKYLEKPYNENCKKYEMHIKTTIKDALMKER